METVMSKTIESLKLDVVKILEWKEKAIENNDMLKVSSMTKMLRDTLYLLDKYDFELMYSTYFTEVLGVMTPVISIWEQNSEGIIKNHRVFIKGVELETSNLTPLND